jgi:NADP-dependent 3-hydroxy acid dehydrogenase YdfG
MARRNDFDLAGALALVTGAGSGIGRAIALELARKGSRVIAVDVDPGTAEKTAVACTEAGPEACGHACDVGDATAVRALSEHVHREHGALDVLVNNAGVGMSGRLSDMTLDDWRWVRGVNLDGVVHCCHAFGPAMLERAHGQVVNLSSVLGYTMRATEPAYVTTKAAVLALSRCLRADWAPSASGSRPYARGWSTRPSSTPPASSAGRPTRSSTPVRCSAGDTRPSWWPATSWSPSATTRRSCPSAGRPRSAGGRIAYCRCVRSSASPAPRSRPGDDPPLTTGSP